MVSRREIGILAVLGIAAFFLSRRASGSTDFGGEPAIPFSILESQKIQGQFDVLGETLEEQDTTIQRLFKELQNALRFTSQTRGSFVGQTTLNPTSGILGRTDPRLGPTNQAVINFGKVPSNFRQGPSRPR